MFDFVSRTTPTGGQELNYLNYVFKIFGGSSGRPDPTRAAFEAFTEGTPIVAASENIENLNYLQCSWACALYSNRRDFAFARRVSGEHPEYRNVLATPVLETIGRVVADDSTVCSHRERTA